MDEGSGSGTWPIAVGAYIFAGGFTLGVKEHFNVLCHLEADNYGVATMRHNQPEIPVFVGANNWPVKELKKLKQIDLIYGNPPCAAWSQANQSPTRVRNWRTDERVACTEHHFSLMTKLKPKVWVWESVVRAFTHGQEFVQNLATRANRQGYHVTFLLHDAQYLGVPQRRARFFFIAHKTALKPVDPDWEVISVSEALRGLNDIGEPYNNGIEKHQWIIPDVRQGENMWAAYNRIVPEDERTIGSRGQVVGRPAFLYRRPKPDLPSCVVMNDKLHPTEDRAMTMNELKVLCGFPPMYEFVQSGPASQLSRGVCPPVGQWLAKSVKNGLRRKAAGKRPTKTTIDLRKPPW